ncbi:MAG: hypothetical protein HY335_09255 [Deinococcus sp.]|nr:hypothetical protein [Deinococcus sp.]
MTIIDAYTKEIVAYQAYDIGLTRGYFEPHGLGVSPDGRWIYLPTADGTVFGAEAVREGSTGVEQLGLGRWLVIDARTLKLHQVVSTRGRPHHAKAIEGPHGEAWVLAYDFNWAGNNSLPGSGLYIFDPANENRVVGGIDGRRLQAMPYLSFKKPNSRYLWVGLPPPSFSDLAKELDGALAIVDMERWTVAKYLPMREDPIWVDFSADGRLAWVSNGGSDEVIKVNAVDGEWEVLSISRSAGHGPYGVRLNWEENQLWLIDKGEGSHNRGVTISLVNPVTMTPQGNFATNCLRGDHITLHPDPDVNELWLSCNSSFEVVVFDPDARQVTARIPMPSGGSTHSGAFVRYIVDEMGNWIGEVLSDQNGLHGSALALKREILGLQ